MLAIGRALMGRPSLLMLDEPSLGLAPIVIEQVFDRIVELNKRTGLGVLLVEQNSAMALEIASRAFVLETGAITLSGPSAVLADDPRIREAYLGGCNDRTLKINSSALDALAVRARLGREQPLTARARALVVVEEFEGTVPQLHDRHIGRCAHIQRAAVIERRETARRIDGRGMR